MGHKRGPEKSGLCIVIGYPGQRRVGHRRPALAADVDVRAVGRLADFAGADLAEVLLALVDFTPVDFGLAVVALLAAALLAAGRAVVAFFTAAAVATALVVPVLVAAFGTFGDAFSVRSTSSSRRSLLS